MKTEQGGEPIVARDATYHRAPDALRARIHAAVAHESRERARPALWRWGAVAAALAATAVVSWNAALMHAQVGAQDAVARDVVIAHVRSLMSEGHLNDVASSDQHTVKPWFQGKLDFAPLVVDPAPAFALTGGRLDYVNGRPVAALAYRVRLHVINVFEWPAASAQDSTPQLVTRQGFSIVRWRRGGLEFCAISDASGPDVLRLAQAISSS